MSCSTTAGVHCRSAVVYRQTAVVYRQTAVVYRQTAVVCHQTAVVYRQTAVFHEVQRWMSRRERECLLLGESGQSRDIG